MNDCPHESYHWEDVEGDPRHPDDDSPQTFRVAICDNPECGLDITKLVGEEEPDVS